MTPDVNVLMAAARSDHVHHGIAREWMEQNVSRAALGAPFTLLPVVAVGFVRLATDRRVFPDPLPMTHALAAIGAVLDAPNVRFGSQGAEWPALAALCEEHALTGSSVTDAWIAASVLHHHEHLVTLDRGFRHFLPPRSLTVQLRLACARADHGRDGRSD